MRLKVIFFTIFAGSHTAYAMPWEEHKVLSNHSVRMTEVPNSKNPGQRIIRTYFERMERWGYKCFAKDGNIDPMISEKDKQSGLNFDRIRVLCWNKSNDKVYYLMKYFDPTYVDIDSIYINGGRLPTSLMIDHQNTIYNETEPKINKNR